MNRLESMAEKSIREAIERGEFDDLPGKGQPLDLSENPFEDPDLRTVHRLLRNAGFAPAWLEERKDIDAQLEIAQTILARAWKLYRPESKSANNAAWEQCAQEFRQTIVELRQRIKIYNLKAPAAIFHRRQLDAEDMIREVMAHKVREK
jgi:DnaJ family protein C protein 28